MFLCEWLKEYESNNWSSSLLMLAWLINRMITVYTRRLIKNGSKLFELEAMNFRVDRQYNNSKKLVQPARQKCVVARPYNPARMASITPIHRPTIRERWGKPSFHHMGHIEPGAWRTGRTGSNKQLCFALQESQQLYEHARDCLQGG